MMLFDICYSEYMAKEKLTRLEKFDHQYSPRMAVLVGFCFGLTPGILLSINKPELAIGAGVAEVIIAGIHIRQSFAERKKLVKKIK